MYITYLICGMAALKILLDDDLGYDLDLIAIHTSLEPYFLAFLLNKHIGFKLERHREDLTLFFNSRALSFARYDYQDKRQDINYYLIENKVKVENEIDKPGLFNSEKSLSISNFISDRPKVDYFVKVVEGGYAFAKAKQKIIKTLNQIPQIVTAYSLSVDELKTKENLIFE